MNRLDRDRCTNSNGFYNLHSYDPQSEIAIQYPLLHPCVHNTGTTRRVCKKRTRACVKTRAMKSGEVDCLICFESLSLADRAAQRCSHHVCKPCFTQYLIVSIMDKCEPFPRCAQLNCFAAASDALVRAHVDEKTAARMNYLRVFYPARAADGRRMWCVRPGCYEPLAPPTPVPLGVREEPGEVLGQRPNFFQIGLQALYALPGDLSRAQWVNPLGEARWRPTGTGNNTGGPAAPADARTQVTLQVSTCGACGSQACMRCAAAAHAGECVVPLTDMRQQQLYAQYAVGRIASCPTCGTHVERNGGCEYMRCSRCFSHFMFNPFTSVSQVLESLAFVNPHAKPRRPLDNFFGQMMPEELGRELRQEFDRDHRDQCNQNDSTNYRNRFFRRFQGAASSGGGSVAGNSSGSTPRTSRFRRLFPLSRSRTRSHYDSFSFEDASHQEQEVETHPEISPLEVSSSTWHTDEDLENMFSTNNAPFDPRHLPLPVDSIPFMPQYAPLYPPGSQSVPTPQAKQSDDATPFVHTPGFETDNIDPRGPFLPQRTSSGSSNAVPRTCNGNGVPPNRFVRSGGASEPGFDPFGHYDTLPFMGPSNVVRRTSDGNGVPPSNLTTRKVHVQRTPAMNSPNSNSEAGGAAPPRSSSTSASPDTELNFGSTNLANSRRAWLRSMRSSDNANETPPSPSPLPRRSSAPLQRSISSNTIESGVLPSGMRRNSSATIISGIGAPDGSGCIEVDVSAPPLTERSADLPPVGRSEPAAAERRATVLERLRRELRNAPFRMPPPHSRI